MIAVGIAGSVRRLSRGVFPVWCSVAFLVAILAVPSAAVEYSLDSSVGLLSRANDNVRLSLDNEEDFYGALLTPSATFLRRTERSRLSSALYLQASHYNLPGYSTFDQRLALEYTRDSERDQWGGSVSANRDSTREAELTAAGSGVFENFASRVNYKDGYFFWNRALSERHSVQWRTDINAARYDSLRFADYDYGSSVLLWQYSFNNRLQLQASGTYAKLRSDTQYSSLSPLFEAMLDAGVGLSEVVGVVENCYLDESADAGFTIQDPGTGEGIAVQFPCLEPVQSNNRQSTVQAELGLFYKFSPHLMFDFLMGRTNVATNLSAIFSELPRNIGGDLIGHHPGTLVPHSDSSTTYSANLNYDDEAWLYRLSGSSSNEANSSGVLSLNTRWVFDINWRWDNRRALLLDVSWMRQQRASQLSDLLSERELFSVRGRYHHRLSANWSVDGGYRFYDQWRPGRHKHARSNEVSLTVSWQPTTLKWSR